MVDLGLLVNLVLAVKKQGKPDLTYPYYINIKSYIGINGL